MVVSPRVPDLSALDVLVSVARLGSMSAAGREHNLSQQTVSARVRSAERQIGVRIFARSAQGVSVTPEGVAVLEWADAVLVSAEHFAAGVQSLREEERAHLTVAASMTIAEHLVPGWTVLMCRRFPETHTLVRLMNSANAVEQVLAGRADLGFIEGPDLPKGLASRVVFEDELIVVVAPGHPWTDKGRVSPGELASTALIHREGGSGTRLTLEQALPGMVEPLLELTSATAMKAAVLTAAAPAVLSSLSVSADLADGRLVAIEVVGIRMPRSLRVIWDQKKTLRGAARDFFDIVVRTQRVPG